MQIFCPVCLITCLLGYIALYFGKNDLWIMTSSLWCFLPAGPIPTRLFQEDPWGGLLKSPEVHGCTLTCCPASSSSDSKLHNLMVTTAKAVFILCISNKAFPVVTWGQAAHHSLWNCPPSGRCHQHFPGTSWTVCGLLCCFSGRCQASESPTQEAGSVAVRLQLL